MSTLRTLLLATARNLFSRGINRSLVGTVFERESEPFGAEEIRAYAAATHDDPARYGGDRPEAPPLFLSRLAYPVVLEAMTHRDLGLNLLRMVHGEQGATWHAPIRAGDRLRLRLTVSEVRETRAGELLVLTAGAWRDGAPVAEATTGFLVRARGRRGGPRGPEVPPPVREEAFRVPIRVDRDQALRYAEASGDRNFIHTSDLGARVAGLPRAILHGVCLLALATHVLRDRAAGGEAARLAAVLGRFARPVLPGETVTLVAYRGDDPGEVPFEVLDGGGRPALREGRLRLRPPG